MAYITVADLAQHLGMPSPNDAQTASLQMAINAAKAQIDGRCGLTFEASATEKVFTPLSTGLAHIGYARDVSAVKIDADGDGTYETTLSETDYQLVGPTRSIYVQLRETASATFPGGTYTVAVVATYGEEDVPDAIKVAMLLQSARLYRRRDATFGIVSNDTGLAHIKEDFDCDALAILRDAGYLRARRRIIR
jgi:uncharacterized phiE125 gp8 family phage protein